MSGIVSYGFYIPRYRIKVEDIASQWDKCGDKVEKSLKINEKAVAGKDEDILTMAYEASLLAFEQKEKLKKEIGAVFIGSETFPYAVKPTSTSLAEWLDLNHEYLAYDTQFACKAATGALISAHALVSSGQTRYALVCASDKANARPQDALEYSAGSGANAWILGSENVLLEIKDWSSYSSDTPDFWRRAKAEYPSHAGRFTGNPAYFHHIKQASLKLLEKTDTKPTDYTYAVFHMPNGSFPLKIAQTLGFTLEQVKQSYIVPKLGNSYSASALMGLVSVLDQAQAGDKIFFASYGSGAGSDAIAFEVTSELVKRRKQFAAAIENKQYINYATYMRFMNIIS
jgi:hydroxymethylglutaryl-CoA synthase